MKYRPDGIILDLVFHDGNGLDLLDEFKKEPKTSHIPVHVVSGQQAHRAALNKGAVSFLHKPITADALEKMFRDLESRLQFEVKNVLVVEDDVQTQEAIELTLARRSVRITRAETGQEGYDVLVAKKFDCLVLDLDHGDMTGFDLLAMIDKNPAIELPPIVVHTGMSLSSQQRAALNAYTDTIIPKDSDAATNLIEQTTRFLHELAPASEQSPSLHTAEDALAGQKILVVDDDMRNTFALSAALEEYGSTVELSGNGQLALETLDRTNDFDLIIMDVMMPVMDGVEAMTLVRKHRHYRHVPMIALTALVADDEEQKCLTAGATAYMAKPVNVEKLVNVMAGLLRVDSSNSDQPDEETVR